jgi:hypothetical protein
MLCNRVPRLGSVVRGSSARKSLSVQPEPSGIDSYSLDCRTTTVGRNTWLASVMRELHAYIVYFICGLTCERLLL